MLGSLSPKVTQPIVITIRLKVTMLSRSLKERKLPWWMLSRFVATIVALLPTLGCVSRIVCRGTQPSGISLHPGRARRVREPPRITSQTCECLSFPCLFFQVFAVRCGPPRISLGQKVVWCLISSSTHMDSRAE